VFDVETKQIGNPYEIDAVAISIISTDDGKSRYYPEEYIREGVEFLLATPGLVGFNSRRFDVPVLLKYMSRGEGRKLRAKPHFDIFYELQQEFPGLRISLANFSRTTLGLEKFELTTDTAIGLYKHDPDKLRAYVTRDTRLTYLLYLHAFEKGYLEFIYPVRRRFYPENFGRTTT